MEKCTRFFTQEQIDEIRRRLTQLSGVKDSQFEKAVTFNKNDQVAIVQQGKNKKIDIGELRNWLFALDDTPTQGSENPVTSDGIYNYIQDIIETIVVEGKYLYIKSDSEMFDYLIHGPGGLLTQEKYNEYCNEVSNAIANDYFIIIDDALCTAAYSDNMLYIYYISPAETVTINASFSHGGWVYGASGVNLDKFLIDNTYLKNNGYITVDRVNTLLSNYITFESLANITDNYPRQNSTNIVTSGGVYSYVQNIFDAHNFKSYLLLDSNSQMIDYLINGTKDGRSQELLNSYCETILSTILDGYLIIIDNAICYTDLNDGIAPPNYGITLKCVTNNLTVETTLLGGIMSGDTTRTWGVLISGTNTRFDTSNYLIDTDKLNETLNGYPSSQTFDTAIADVNGRINDLRDEYRGRMQVTPQFHRLNWITAELDGDQAHTSTAWEITDESTAAESALKRLTSLVSAVYYNTLYNYQPKIMTFFQENVVNVTYVGTSINPTSATVKTFDGENVTTYLIEKQQRTGTSEIYLSVTKSVATVVQ